jgi:hypothetical protein
MRAAPTQIEARGGRLFRGLGGHRGAVFMSGDVVEARQVIVKLYTYWNCPATGAYSTNRLPPAFRGDDA